MKGKAMATLPNNTGNVSSDDEFPMPDEFIADETKQGEGENNNYSHNAPSQQGGSLSWDDFADIKIDHNRDEIERAKLNPPTGDWIKSDRAHFDKRVTDSDSLPGDIDTNGRTIIYGMIKPEPRQQNGIEYTPVLFLRLSPDIRYKQDKPHEVDQAYKNYLLCLELYLELYGHKLPNLLKLRDMLQEDRYILRTMLGDNGLIVVGIKSTKKQQGRRQQ